MARLFNDSVVELLAPAGTFDIFKEIIKCGCDAVYLGGKGLNMRMHRKDFNLTNDELEQAVSIAHSLHKKLYVTVNNLHSQQDLNQLKEYLVFLEKINPDALIVQDLSVLKIVKDLGLKLNLHCSVMMDIHNVESIKVLKDDGVQRIVISRETPLSDVMLFKKETGLEFEYFIHGDMCTAQGGKCLYSGMLFGQSANRGRCLKPCRWDYKVKLNGNTYNTEFPIAARDMYMYESIPELIASGVNSFKIEGRMRDAQYIKGIVDTYGDAIDRYIDDPLCYDRKKDADFLYDNRKRDFSTFYALGNNAEIINRRLEGTGAFYSTGKVFSTATEEKELSIEVLERLNGELNAACNNSTGNIQISARVNSFKCAEICLSEGVDHIYLSGDVFLPDKPFSKEEVRLITKYKGKSKIYLALPRVMTYMSFDEYSHVLKHTADIDGLLVTNIGAAAYFKNSGYPLIGDYSLNIYNHVAAEYYASHGISVFTPSLEMPLGDMIETIKESKIQAEIVVHGAPTVMIFQHSLYEAALKSQPSGKEGNKHVADNILTMCDEKGNDHPVYKDNRGKEHMLTCKELCYMGLMDGFHGIGVNRFRIEGCHYSADELQKVVRAYKNRDASSLRPLRQGFTAGAFDW